MTPRYYLRRGLTLKVLRRQRSQRVVEFGCGTGRLLLDLSKRGFEGVGVEPGEKSFSAAAERLHGTRFDIVADPAHPTGSFPIGIALEVLEHLPDDGAALREWSRWLEVGGTLIVSVPADPDLWSESDERVGHVRRYTPEGLVQVLESSGFEIEAVWRYGYPLTWLTHRLRPSAPTACDASLRDRTLDSAMVSETSLLGSLASRAIAAAGQVAQLPFLNSDWGDGLFAVARRR